MFDSSSAMASVWCRCKSHLQTFTVVWETSVHKLVATTHQPHSDKPWCLFAAKWFGLGDLQGASANCAVPMSFIVNTFKSSYWWQSSWCSECLWAKGTSSLVEQRMVQAAGEMVPPTLTIIEVEEGWKLLDVGRFLDAFLAPAIVELF